MDLDIIKQKLTIFTDNFSFLEIEENEKQEFVENSIQQAKKKMEETDKGFPKLCLKYLKKQIRNKINELYKLDRKILFNKLLLFLEQNQIEDIRKLKLLDSVISTIEVEIERQFYRDILIKNEFLSNLMIECFIKNKKRQTVIDLELLSMYPNLKELLDQCVEMKNIQVEEDIKNEKDLLTYDEIKAIYRRIKSGDETAKEELIIKNMRLVQKIASKYMNRGVDFEDLVQEGVLGLNTAIDRYNPKLGYAFSTFSVWYIRQKIQRYIEDNQSTIRIPVHKRQWLRDIKSKINKLETELGRKATKEEIIEKLGITEENIEEYFCLSYPIVSLNDKLKSNSSKGDDTDEFSEFVADPSNQYEELLSAIANESILGIIKKILTEREFYIVCMRNGIVDGREHTLEEIGSQFNVTRERIRQIEAKAYRKLRTSGKLHSYDVNLESKIKLRAICNNDAQAVEYIKYKTMLNNKEMNDYDIARKMHISIEQLEEIRKNAIYYLQQSDDYYAKSLLGKLTATKISRKEPEIREKTLLDILEGKYQKETIPLILQQLSEEELKLLKEKYGEEFKIVNRIENDIKRTKINQIIFKTIPMIYERLKKENEPQQPQITSKTSELNEERKNKLDIILRAKYKTQNIEDVLKILSDEEKELLITNPKTDEELIENTILLVLGKIIKKETVKDKEEKKSDKDVKPMIKAKSFKQILEEKYTTEEQHIILEKLSAEDLNTLQCRYGETLDKVIKIDDKQILGRVNTIIYMKIPKIVSKPKETTPRKAKTMMERLRENYTEEECQKILDSLSSEDLKILQSRYGENLDQILEIEDKKVIARIHYIINTKIPNSIAIKKEQPGEIALGLAKKDSRKKTKTFVAYLNKKYQDEEDRKIIFEQLSEEEIKLLQKKYGESLDQEETKEKLSEQDKTRIRNLMYVQIPSRLKLVKEKTSPQVSRTINIEELQETDKNEENNVDDSFILKIKPSLVQIRDALTTVISLIEQEENKKEASRIKAKSPNNNS